MAKPSVYRQVEATPIATNCLKDSPRHWNNGLFRYNGQLWMSYRYHLMTNSGRCKTAICPIDEATLQPSGPSQMLDLPEENGDEHTEDARLFVHNNHPYVSYTEMTGYRPGVDFKCVMKYARLKLVGKRWRVEEAFLPKYGRNDWQSKEKNWVFFTFDGRLFCIYQADPDHKVLEIEGDKVVSEYTTAKPFWEWGILRGGTPPIILEDGTFLTVFHSSIPTEVAPAYVRYFAGAYRFEGKPPFRILGISPRPILSASEEDGHRVDPRYIDGWKPYVVFPCGLVQAADKYLVSFGINDWQSAIARIRPSDIPLMAPDGSELEARCFRRKNGSMPFSIFSPNRQPKTYHWIVPAPGPGCSSGEGYIRLSSQRDAQEISELAGVEEISVEEYERRTKVQMSASLSFR